MCPKIFTDKNVNTVRMLWCSIGVNSRCQWCIVYSYGAVGHVVLVCDRFCFVFICRMQDWIVGSVTYNIWPDCAACLLCCISGSHSTLLVGYVVSRDCSSKLLLV